MSLAQVVSSESIDETEVTMPDWILDARAIDASTIGLVTAHNTLFTYSLQSKRVTQRINCDEQSLLYAAQIYISESKKVTIATGTVFNEIQIWHPSTTLHSKTTTSTIPITTRLQGHEGCIFSLRFNETGNLLASCSDDRTIRVWDITSGTCIAIGFAHIARVWDVRFLPNSTATEVFLLSNSEDTTALLWRLSLTDRTLKVQERYQGHGGKHVWSQAVSSDGTLAATGGNDGGVNIWDIGEWKARAGQNSKGTYWTEKSPRMVVDGKEKTDEIKGYCSVDDDRLLITTKSGYEFCRGTNCRCVYTYYLSTKEWKLIFREDRLQGFATLGTLEGMEGWICLGDSKGQARLFHVDRHQQVYSSREYLIKNFEWTASPGLIVAFYKTVCNDRNVIYILAQGIHPQTSLSVISGRPVISGKYTLT
jgi:WD40 repeat protein